jgi:hypothetical protein
MSVKQIVTGKIDTGRRFVGASCSDIDAGVTPVQCACGKLRQATRRCGEKRVVRDLRYRPCGG